MFAPLVLIETMLNIFVCIPVSTSLMECLLCARCCPEDFKRITIWILSAGLLNAYYLLFPGDEETSLTEVKA